ncbi:MAG TPA: CHRD domain-containing protein [Caulobacteraceae bacterium]|jgi:hypothetical protein|nr:CHRD domain-containing protein [Caulobacteraceae bacterium]
MLRKSLLMAFGVAVLSTAAQAEMLKFTAKLDGASETPPNDSRGAGHADLSLDTDAHMLKWVVDYSGLTGPATMAHLHGPAPVGKAAGVLVPLTPPLGSPISGQASVTDAQIGDIRAGSTYVNVHTAAHPAGEIRGQVVPAP